MVQTTLIILTRNELSGLTSLLVKIPLKTVDEYFLVDYHSTDGTVEFAKRNGIPVIKQTKPGRAEAFRIGYRKAHGNYLVFFSPDGNENPDDIPKLISLLRRGGADMAIASRFLPTSRNEEDDLTFKWRAWANRGFTRLANTCFHHGPYISDTINGYRAITKDAFEQLHLDAEGFAIEYQMSMRAMKLGLSVKEIPTIEGARIGGNSTSYAIPTGLKFVYYFFRELFIGSHFL